MPAPIPNTCPDINAVQYDIKEQHKSIQDLVNFIHKEHKIEPTSYGENVMGILNDIAYNLEPLFTQKKYSWHRENPLEALRQSNEVLRSWGQDMEEENNVAEDKIKDLESTISDLQQRVDYLESQIHE